MSGKRWLIVLQCLLLAGLVTVMGLAGPIDRQAIADVAAGDRHLAAGEYGAALSHYVPAAERLPRGAEVPLRMAQAYLGRRDASRATEQAGLAADRLRGSRRAGAAALLGQAWYLAGDANSAARHWEKALAEDRDNRPARLGMAAIFDEVGEPERAVQHLRALVERDPADAEAAYRLGLVQIPSRREEALQAFERAAPTTRPPWAERARRLADTLLATQDDAYGAARLGVALLEVGELRPALRQFERATALNPAYAEAHAYRGHLLAALGRPASAAFERALSLEPRLVLGHYFLGRYYQSFGLSSQALEEYEAALALDRGNPALYMEIAQTYAAEGQYATAGEWLDAAVERAPADEKLTLARARFYIERGYQVGERGLPAVEKLLSSSPQSAEGHDLRGWALHWLLRPAEAVEELRRAVELAPDDASARLHFGVALLGVGRRAEAHEQLERAIDLDPDGYCGRWAAGLLR